jgi:hypothetical protein
LKSFEFGEFGFARGGSSLPLAPPGNDKLRPLCEAGKKNEFLCKRLAGSKKFWTANLSDFVRVVVKRPFIRNPVF